MPELEPETGHDTDDFDVLERVLPPSALAIVIEIAVLDGDESADLEEADAAGHEYLRAIGAPSDWEERDPTDSEIDALRPSPEAVAELERRLGEIRDRVRSRTPVARSVLVRLARPFLPRFIRSVVQKEAKR